MFLSICTPTFNRAYTLTRLYESLKSQTEKDFEWIVVDDGSNDNTKELITNWIVEEEIRIKYIYQSNQGKHVAFNKGVEHSTGTLFTCLDSDDWFYENTIEIIKGTWKKINMRELLG